MSDLQTSCKNNSAAKLFSETISLEQLAVELGKSPDTLKRSYRTLHARFGLPLPIGASNWRWSKFAVAAYLQACASVAYGNNAQSGANNMHSSQAKTTTANQDENANDNFAEQLAKNQNAGLHAIYSN